MSIQFMSVTIGMGKGVSLGISENDEIMLNHSNNITKVEKQLGTGVTTKRELDYMIEYLQRLRIHLPDSK